MVYTKYNLNGRRGLVEFMSWLFSLLDKQMEKPELFGVFHILSLFVMVGIIVFFVFLFKKNQEKRLKIVLIIFASTFIFLEILKQSLFTYQAWQYQWYAFPFQFCSVPIYLLPLVLIVKNIKIKVALYNFLSFYVILAGLAVMIYPGDVFTSDIVINFQTMIHHMSMVLIGVAIALAGKNNFSWRGFLESLIIFSIILVIALVINIIGHFSGLENFNMFFISPYKEGHLPVFSIIQAKAPYPIFLFSYIFGFSLGALLIKYLLQSTLKVYNRKRQKTAYQAV